MSPKLAHNIYTTISSSIWEPKRADMIKAILIFNNHGKPRLIRFYQYFVSILAAAAKNINS